MIGKTISHYKILEKLGEGGMGVVYKAQDLKLDRLVALKFLPPHLASDEQDKKRFVQEAKAASSLDHPNICNVHEIDEAPDGQVFIVMAIYEGAPLNKKIEKGPLKINEALDVVIQAAEGLHAAHEKGIVHRDVKSSNIMMTDKGRAVIMDFGLARTGGATKLTKTGSTLGTVPYMSPEQARGEKVDHRTDIWSLGVVLYEMIVGRLPFKSEYQEAIVYSILNENPQPVTGMRTGIPVALESVVNKCLEKKPSDRYQHADELIVDLRRVRGQIGREVVVPKPLVLVRSRILIYVGAVVVVGAVISLLLLLPPSSTTAERKSIAVLPFENLSEDKENEYFSDGITEDIITQLSKIGELKVISRTSAMRYKNSDKPLRDIGKELGVITILEGSVRRAGNQVRIVAQLIDAQSDEHLWAETYDKELTQIFAIQSDVAQKIAAALEAKLTETEKERIDRKPTSNLEAYNLYLLGRFHWNKRTGESLLKAIDYFTRALEQDSVYALAYSGIADCYSLLPWYGGWLPKEASPKAEAAALKALEIDSTLGEAYTSLGALKNWYKWDFTSAFQDHKRALELNPNYATGHHWYGFFLASRGHFKEAESEVKRALELDPFSPIINTNYGDVAYYARRFNEAIDRYQHTLEISPNFGPAHYGLGKAYLEEEMYDRAVEELLKYDAGEITKAYIALGRRQEALAVLEGLKRHAARERVNPITFAKAYIGLGENNHAFEALEKAYEERSPWLPEELKVDPYFDPLRFDPRFQDLLMKAGLDK